ncbi:MAG TPA: 50S ribosomal protein L23 [Methylomirabilota bacterium]|nr:50S ribosomal protein L23 [Methylomirabilota bacterium]
MRSPREVVIRPLLTEKSTILKENQNQVLFQVAPDANKVEIRRAIETIFNVKVRDVRTIVMEGKLKRMGKHEGRRPGWKKAIISLQPGHKIDLVEGA